jgi:hypothetical protein
VQALLTEGLPGKSPTKEKMMKLIAIVLASALALQGCGGGDVPAAPPVKIHHRVPETGHQHLLLFRDAAELEDYTEISEYPYIYSVASHAVLVGSTNPSASAVRVWVIDTLSTSFISDLRIEK